MRTISALGVVLFLAGCAATDGPKPEEVLQAVDEVTFEGDAAGNVAELRNVSCVEITDFNGKPVPNGARVMACTFEGRTEGASSFNSGKITMVKIGDGWTEYYSGIV